MDTLRVIDYVESAICEEERRSNPENQFQVWIASCLAMTQSDDKDCHPVSCQSNINLES